MNTDDSFLWKTPNSSNGMNRLCDLVEVDRLHLDGFVANKGQDMRKPSSFSISSSASSSDGPAGRKQTATGRKGSASSIRSKDSAYSADDHGKSSSQESNSTLVDQENDADDVDDAEWQERQRKLQHEQVLRNIRSKRPVVPRARAKPPKYSVLPGANNQFLDIPQSAMESEQAFKDFLVLPVGECGKSPSKSARSLSSSSSSSSSAPVPPGQNNKAFMFCNVYWDDTAKCYQMVHHGSGMEMMRAVKRRDGLKLFDPSSNFVIHSCFPTNTPTSAAGKSPSLRDSNSIGKLRGNAMGSFYQMFDTGASPGSIPENGIEEVDCRHEFGAVKFDIVPGNFRDRRVTFVHRANGYAEKCRRTVDDILFSDYVKTRGSQAHADKFQCLANNIPLGSKADSRAVLFPLADEMEGVAAVESVKNMVLHDVDDVHGHRVEVVFGRVSKHSFNLMFRNSVSPYVAFCIAVSSIDSKVIPTNQW